MHEISLAAEILRLVQAAALREQFTQVAVLRLEAGALAGVEPQALRFALQAQCPGTCLAQARIEIEEVPGRAWCGVCACEVPIGSRADACPGCGAVGLKVRGGDRLRVVDLLVQDEEARTGCA